MPLYVCKSYGYGHAEEKEEGEQIVICKLLESLVLPQVDHCNIVPQRVHLLCPSDD